MRLGEKALKEAFPNAEVSKRRTTGWRYSQVSLTVEFGDTNGYALMQRITMNQRIGGQVPLAERQCKWQLKVAKYSEPRTVTINSTLIFENLSDDEVIPKIREGAAKLGVVI
jgi:hypothetical protein